MIYSLAGLLLWLLAFLIRYLPERAAILLWGKRTRFLWTRPGPATIDRMTAANELKITGSILILKTLLDLLLWSFFKSPYPF